MRNYGKVFKMKMADKVTTILENTCKSQDNAKLTFNSNTWKITENHIICDYFGLSMILSSFLRARPIKIWKMAYLIRG